MKNPLIIKTSLEKALDEIFKNSPKRSSVRLISCEDRFGDMFITETQKIFIPWLDDNTQKIVNKLQKLLNKPRRSKRITVRGLERYLKYNRTSDIDNSNDNMGKNNTYDLTDDGTGKKYDSGKSMVGTLCRVFPRALLGIGRCIEFGTHKYPKPDNWKLVDGAFTRYQDSLMRHYLKFLSGETKDSETNILHLCHMAWNTLAILELYLMEHKEEFDKELFK